MSVINELQASTVVAKQLEEDGYSVILEPNKDAIPFDLGKYRPDILAIKPGDNVLIEVKRFGNRRPTEIYTRVLETVAQHPNWSFKIITLPQDLPISSTRATGSVMEIVSMLNRVDALIAQPALMNFAITPLWSAYTSALRLLVGQHTNKEPPPTDLSLLNSAYTLGLLSFDEFSYSKLFFQLRNKAVHELDIDISPANILELRRRIDMILNLLEQ